jgi:Cu2+-exporting ATPase
MTPITLLIAGAVAYAGKRMLEYLNGSSEDEEAAAIDAASQEGAAIATPVTPADVPAQEISAAEREINRGLVTSVCGLALALSGTFLAPGLLPLSSALTLYSSMPLFQRAYQALFEERRLRASVLDALAVLGGQMGGFMVASAFGSLTYNAGCKLLIRTEDQSRNKLITVFGTQKRTVWLVRDGVEVETPLHEVHVGDRVSVHAGQVVPVDGLIREGSASVDQHMLTGESQPVDKVEGDRVLASTLVLAGRVLVEVEQTGSQTVVARIGEMLNATADYRAEIEHRSERIGDASVLPLIGLSGLALATLGSESAVILLGCNFADNIRVSGPLAMLNFIGIAAEHSILIKDGRALERLHEVDTVVFDKTGTLTLEQPEVGTIHPCGELDARTLLGLAAVAEARQTHPIARAIVDKARELAVPLPVLDGARYEVGYGITALIAGRSVQVGSARYLLRTGVPIPPDMHELQASLHEQGSSLVFVAVDGVLAGALEMVPRIRAEMIDVVQALRARGLQLHILSGDHDAPTRRLAAQLGIERYHAEVLPADKAARIHNLQRGGRKVCFIGDGINDTIALKAASSSISLRGATTAATDTAQILLLRGDLKELPRLFSLSDEYVQNARNGLLLSVGAGVVCAASVFLFQIGIFTAIVLYNVSFLASVVNAMMPRLRPPETLRLPEA